MDERTPLQWNHHNSTTTTTAAPTTTARGAFEHQDVDASRKYHENKVEENHQSEGGWLKPVVFGGLDGILTSFAIVAGAAGGQLSPQVVLVLGFRYVGRVIAIPYRLVHDPLTTIHIVTFLPTPYLWAVVSSSPVRQNRNGFSPNAAENSGN